MTSSSSTRAASKAHTSVGSAHTRGVGRTSRRRRLPAPIPGPGRPVRSALSRVPFVIALIAVLSVGTLGVLLINTKTDESGIRTEQAKAASSQMRLQIEALSRTVAQLNATPRLAQQAQTMGLTPAGDAAILVIHSDGTTKLIGKPHAVKQPATSKATG